MTLVPPTLASVPLCFHLTGPLPASFRLWWLFKHEHGSVGGLDQLCGNPQVICNVLPAMSSAEWIIRAERNCVTICCNNWVYWRDGKTVPEHDCRPNEKLIFSQHYNFPMGHWAMVISEGDLLRPSCPQRGRPSFHQHFNNTSNIFSFSLSSWHCHTQIQTLNFK